MRKDHMLTFSLALVAAVLGAALLVGRKKRKTKIVPFVLLVEGGEDEPIVKG
jgi:LPXTG-motif cell wall-anchored protein